MMMGIRKLMDFVFTRSELYWLDHILPGDERIRREDERAMMQAAHPYPQVYARNSGFLNTKQSQNIPPISRAGI